MIVKLNCYYYYAIRLSCRLFIKLLTCNFPIMQEALPRWTATTSRWRKDNVDRGSGLANSIIYYLLLLLYGWHHVTCQSQWWNTLDFSICTCHSIAAETSDRQQIHPQPNWWMSGVPTQRLPSTIQRFNAISFNGSFCLTNADPDS